jgi:hypothetical protein
VGYERWYRPAIVEHHSKEMFRVPVPLLF